MDVVYGLFIVAGWITGLCIVADLSTAKGFNWVKWSAFAMFFNPAVLLILIIFPADQLGIDALRVRRGERVRCPRCLEVMHPEAGTCPHCRNKLTWRT